MPNVSTPSLTLQDLMAQLNETCPEVDGDYSCARHAVLVHQLIEMYQMVQPYTLTAEGLPFEALNSHVIKEQQWVSGKSCVQSALQELRRLGQQLSDTPSTENHNRFATALIQLLERL